MNKPSQRCRIQNETCVDRPSSTFHTSASSENDSPALPSPQSICEFSASGNGSTIVFSEQRPQSQCSTAVPEESIQQLSDVMPALSHQNTQHDPNPFPNNFNFTTPEVHLMDNLPTAHLPYDVLDFMRDTDFLLDEIDTLDFDFNAGLPSFPQEPAPIGERQHLNRDDGPGDLQQQEGTVSRIEAFKKSPWYVNFCV